MAGKSKHKTPFSEEIQRHSMYAGSTPTKQNGSLRPSPASVSMSALREAFEASDHRSHGSPVMAMKETIDSHFNGTMSKSNLVNDSVDGETYLYPVVSDEPHPADDDFNEVRALFSSQFKHTPLSLSLGLKECLWFLNALVLAYNWSK